MGCAFSPVRWMYFRGLQNQWSLSQKGLQFAGEYFYATIWMMMGILTVAKNAATFCCGELKNLAVHFCLDVQPTLCKWPTAIAVTQVYICCTMLYKLCTKLYNVLGIFPVWERGRLVWDPHCTVCCRDHLRCGSPSMYKSQSCNLDTYIYNYWFIYSISTRLHM